MDFYLFNSVDFALFFIIVFSLYWVLPMKSKNIILVFASYIFYATWSWKLLSLILISTLANYFCCLKMHNSGNSKSRDLYLMIAIVFNLSMLGFFKYYNFFIENLAAILDFLGISLNLFSLDIILPLGISFYTFRVLSYNFDIYMKKFVPTNDILLEAAFRYFHRANIQQETKI